MNRAESTMSEKRLLVDELHTSAEEVFCEDTSQYTNMMTCGGCVEMRPYTRFNKSYHYILTIIDVLNKHLWAELKVKSRNEVTKTITKIIRDDERCPKKFAY